MSRSAPKARAEKGRAPSVPVPPPPPPPAQNVDCVDIVPGRLSKSDWVAMVEQEEGEEVVAEIMDELMHSVMEKCYKLYLQKQLIPFTVCRARDALVKMVEWQFLVRDEGEEPGSRLLWEQDGEPEPCGIDSWAQGCVPVIHSRPTRPNALPQRTLEHRGREVVDRGGPQPQNEHRSASKEDLSDRDPSKYKNQNEGLSFKAPTLTPHPPLKRDKRRKQPHPHRATLPVPQADDSLPLLRGSLSRSISKEEELPTPKGQTARASKSKCTPKHPDLTVVKRLDPAYLPRHYVWPGFEVLESSISQQPSGKVGGPPVPRQKQDKYHTRQSVTLKPLLHSEGSHKARRRGTLEGALFLSTRSVNIQDTGQSQGPIPVSAGLILDAMVLAPGVTLKDPLGVHTGSYKKYPSQSVHRTNLKPISNSLPTPLLSLDQLMSG